LVSVLKGTNIGEILEKGQYAISLFIKQSLFLVKVTKSVAKDFVILIINQLGRLNRSGL
jgi:hypothetical protein